MILSKKILEKRHVYVCSLLTKYSTETCKKDIFASSSLLATLWAKIKKKDLLIAVFNEFGFNWEQVT